MGQMVRVSPSVAHCPILTSMPISTPIAIIDDADHIVAVLLGRPMSKPGTVDDWPDVVAGLEAAINELGNAAHFSAEDRDHRRGPLPAKDFGVSHGGGQKVCARLSLQQDLC